MLQANLCLSSACTFGTKGKGPGQQEERTRLVVGRWALQASKAPWAYLWGYYHFTSPEPVLSVLILALGGGSRHQAGFRWGGAYLVVTAAVARGASWSRWCGLVLGGPRRQNQWRPPREAGFASQDRLTGQPCR